MKTKLVILDFATSCVDIIQVPDNLANKDVELSELVSQLGYKESQVQYMCATSELGLNIDIGDFRSKITID